MCLRNQITGKRIGVLSRLQGKMREKFDVALRTLDGREREIADGKTERLCKGDEVLKHLFVDRSVADDALFADLVPARFKLRLNQAQDLSRWL